MPLLSFRSFLASIEEDYKTAKTAFLLTTKDDKAVQDAIDKFKEIQNSLKGEEKNIDWWTKQGWVKFHDFINLEIDMKHKDQLTLRDDAEWLIVVPLNHTASCFHGTNTDWCTAKPNQPYFSQYFFDVDIVLIYCIRKADKNKWAIAARFDYIDRSEYFDQKDKSIKSAIFDSQTGLSSRAVIDLAHKEKEEIDRRRILNKQTDIGYLLKRAAGHGPDPSLEKRILASKSAMYVFEYAKDVLDGPFPAGEHLIAKSAQYSALYALMPLRRNVKKGFKAGEESIADSPEWSYFYARSILKDIFPLGEPAIIENIEYAFMYARDVIKGRFEEAEDILSTDAHYAYQYALEALRQKRFPAGEAAIADNSQYAYEYARTMIKGRWEPGEAAIADSNYAYRYAKNVIKGRFPAGEPQISKNPDDAYKYARDFLPDENAGTWRQRYLAGEVD